MRLLRLILIFLSLAIGVQASARADSIGSITLEPGRQSYELNPVAQYYEDAGRKASLDDILRPELADRFRAKAGIFQFGYTPSAYWMRLRIRNGSRASARWVLALESTDLLEVDFYGIAPDNRPDGRTTHLKSGSLVPIRERPVPEREFAFPVELGPNEVRDVYFRVTTRFAMILGASAFSPEAFQRDRRWSDFLLTLYFGGTIALVVFNLFLLFSFRVQSYLCYALWAASFGILAFIIGGFADEQWGGLMSGWARLVEFARIVSVIFACLFARAFLNTKNLSPGHDRLIRMVVALCAGFSWLSFTPYVRATGIIFDTLSLVAIGAVSGTSIHLLRSGFKPARYYLLALTTLFLMTFFWIAFLHGLIPGKWLRTSDLAFGSSVELVLFSLALAHQIHALRMELISRVKEANSELERRVRERTRELEQEIVKREEAQRLITEQRSKLVSSSRLSALGEMAAGIAHEINTPLATIQLYAGQLSEAAEQTGVEPSRCREIARNIATTVARIASIIRGLRAFAREGDRDPFVEAGLKDIVSDALILCGERMRANRVELRVGEFSDRLRIECRATQIAQVFLNFLNNAYDAIEHLPEKWIRLDVRDEGERVRVAITDSGTGIPREIADKIFQPFFTTKPMGKGTGLGLSISSGIVEEHHGSIRLDNSDANTCFVITLPKKQGGDAGPRLGEKESLVVETG